MNKKGALFHWMIFGLLIAIAVFFIASKNPIIVGVKGQWSADFLKGNYLEAQKQLLSEEVVLRNVGVVVAKELAANGGFSKGNLSICETINNTNLWNKNDTWCVSDMKIVVNQEVSAKLKEKIKQINFSEVGFEGRLLFVKGEKKEISSNAGKYIYDTSVGVDLGYSFNDYESVKNEAMQLVESCKNKKKLSECLEKNKRENWKFSSCEKDKGVYSTVARKVVFCVESPNNYYLISSSSFLPVPELVQYKLALDFAPNILFVVENMMIDPQNGVHAISFDKDEMATAYKIYYTDWNEVTSHIPGEVSSVFMNLPKDPTLRFYETVLVKDLDKLTCETTKEVNKASLCNDKVMYNLFDSRLLKDKSYVLMVTTVVGDKESDIGSFVELK